LYLTVEEIVVKFLLPLGASLHTYIYIFIHRSIICTSWIECGIYHEKIWIAICS